MADKVKDKAATIRSEGVSKEDADKAARANEKQMLIDEIALYSSRMEALEELKKERIERLRYLMGEDGDRKLVTESGEAGFATHRSFAVHNPAMLLKLFPNKTLAETALFLAERFKPAAEFVDGATQAGLDVPAAITVGLDERFKVERARSKAAKERQAQIIEQTRNEAQEHIANVAKSMRAGSKKGASK